MQLLGPRSRLFPNGRPYLQLYLTLARFSYYLVGHEMAFGYDQLAYRCSGPSARLVDLTLIRIPSLYAVPCLVNVVIHDYDLDLKVGMTRPLQLLILLGEGPSCPTVSQDSLLPLQKHYLLYPSARPTP
jgi:hypothetical protein